MKKNALLTGKRYGSAFASSISFINSVAASAKVIKLVNGFDNKKIEFSMKIKLNFKKIIVG